LAREPGRNAALLHAWNLFGLADLIAAIALGVTSADGSLLQVFPAPGSMAMQRLPWSFVPTVLVPLWMMLHGAIFVQLLRATRPTPSRGAPGWGGRGRDRASPAIPPCAHRRHWPRCRRRTGSTAPPSRPCALARW